MRRSISSWAVLALVVAGPGQALAGVNTSGNTAGGADYSLGADPSILFNFTNGIDTASGVLTTTSLGGGQYWATSGTLTVTGPAAGTWSIFPGGPAQFNIPGFFVDNIVYPSSDPVLDIAGLALWDGANTYLNIWGGGAPGFYSFATFNTTTGYGVLDTNLPASTTAEVVPEPGTLLLLAAGVSGLAARRRRSRQ